MRQMRLLTPILLSLLIVSLFIQNTCPRGFAGKSAVAATCSHCPHAKLLKAPPINGQTGIKPHATCHPPMYVLELPDTRPSFLLLPLSSSRPALADPYRDAFPDELLRPPRA